MGQNFDGSRFLKFEAPWVGDLPYILKNCRRGPWHIRLCVEKTYNFDEIRQRRTCRQKWGKILMGHLTKFEAPWVGACPTCLKIADEALGLLGCVLKSLKILMKLDSDRPVGKNGAKFWLAPFPEIWSPLSTGPALHAKKLLARP